MTSANGVDASAIRAEILAEERPDALAVETERLRVNQAARAQVAMEGWTPPTVYESVAKQLARPIPPVRYVVDQLAPVGSNIALLAQWKAGKTTLALNLFADASAGRPFLGKYQITLRKGTGVTYTNFEVGEGQILRWTQDMEPGETQRLYMDHWQGERLPLPSDHVEAWMIALLKKRRSSVWIIDTFGSAYEGEENDNTQVTAWTKAIDRIKKAAKLDLVVIVIHTGTGSGTRNRGATKLMDWPTGFWSWHHGGDNQDLPPDNYRYIRAFGRDIDTGPEITVDYDVATKRYFIAEGSPSRQQADIAKKASEAYEIVKRFTQREGNPCNSGQFFGEVGIKSTSASANAWRAALRMAEEKGWLRMEYVAPSKFYSLGENNPHAEVRKPKQAAQAG